MRDNFDLTILFYQFLDTQSAKQLWLDNVREQTHRVVSRVFSTRKPEDWILDTFTWTDTLEGKVFWCAVNTQWLTYLDNSKRTD